MTNRLLTIAGIYDGKTIQPLETIATDKKQRVLITFLDEPEPNGSSQQNGNGKTLNLSNELVEQLQPIVRAAGADDVESYVLAMIKENVFFAKNKARFYEITDAVRAGIEKAGISEEEILEDFERFRRTLPRT